MIAAVVFGHLGSDAEVRVTPGGASVLNFSLASNTRKKEDGEWKEATDWIKVAFFGERGAKLAQYLTKGKGVVVRGSLTTRDFQKRDGTMGYSLELKADDIEFAGKGEGKAETQRPAARGFGEKAPTPPAQTTADAGDEELPF